jgi:hypothetical protein
MNISTQIILKSFLYILRLVVDVKIAGIIGLLECTLECSANDHKAKMIFTFHSNLQFKQINYTCLKKGLYIAPHSCVSCVTVCVEAGRLVRPSFNIPM